MGRSSWALHLPGLARGLPMICSSRGVRACGKLPDVELVAVTKRYGATVAVDNVDLKIRAGTYCCLLGPSGCGKTSTLRMIAGHETVSEGDVILGTENITDLPPAARGTAMMFQNYALFPASQRARQRRLLAEDERHRQGGAARPGRRHAQAGGDGASMPTACRRSFPAASSSASRSPGRWSPIRRSFSSTSRCRRSTRSSASRSAPS